MYAWHLHVPTIINKLTKNGGHMLYGNGEKQYICLAYYIYERGTTFFLQLYFNSSNVLY